MKDQNIICLSKDWSEDPTSNNHVMMELAKRNRVLWVNSIGTRIPNLKSGRDLRKLWRKVTGFSEGVKQVADNLWVFTPMVLPLPHSPIASRLNRQCLRFCIDRICRKLGMHQCQLWTFLPNTNEYLGTCGELIRVYYCVDEWSQFNYVNGARIATAEEKLCRNVDIVFVTASSLLTRRLQWNAETHVARHGVDHKLFSKSLEPGTEIPADIAGLKRPIVGFYGTLQDWVDQELISYLAVRHREWSFALIGASMVNLERLEKHPNIHIFGRRPHGQLPNYCKAFDVGIIPYVLNERIRHVNPIKLREYLCAGLPVVCVDLPEAAVVGRFCSVANTYSEFERAIGVAIQTDSVHRRAERNAAMKTETWEARVSDVTSHVMRVLREKCEKKRSGVPV